MKKRIAIYGGTELSAADSWFVKSLTHALLTNIDAKIITGGFLYWPDRVPGAISTDFSVLQGAKEYALENRLELDTVLETWLPDPEVENDPHKKNVVRFREGAIKDLKGETAQERRFSMIRDVDALITVRGSKHTVMVLDFAVTVNKPAFPLAFTGGDSKIFWNANKDRIKEWFDIDKEFANALEIESMEKKWSPELKNVMLKKIVDAVKSGLERERQNQEFYKQIRENFRSDERSTEKIMIAAAENNKTQPSQDATKKKQLKMFLSYAHEDVQLKDELDKSLTALKRDERISIWQDKNIGGGEEWDTAIKEGLENADIILLLISPDFIASDYIWNVELKYALQKHEQGKAKVIPIFLRSVFIANMPFTKLQGYISLEKPIASFLQHERDSAYKQVVEGINDDINRWLNRLKPVTSKFL